MPKISKSWIGLHKKSFLNILYPKPFTHFVKSKPLKIYNRNQFWTAITTPTNKIKLLHTHITLPNNSSINITGNNPNKFLIITVIYLLKLSVIYCNRILDAIYVMHSISFRTFFVQAFKIVVDSWTFTMLLLYFLWDDWPIFMISGSNEQLQKQLEYTLLKSDCHSWWILKVQSDTLEERYAIKFCFKRW